MESKKRFSPSKLVPDFDRRYTYNTKAPIIDTAKLPNPIKDENFINYFKKASKKFKSNQSQPFKAKPELFQSQPKTYPQSFKSSSSEWSEIDFDSKRILAIIAKEKYECFRSISEFELEENLSKNLIDTRYLATPFEDELIPNKKDPTSLNSSSQLSYATNRDSYLEHKMKKDILNNRQIFKKFKVNDYFFQNLEEFENKFFKKNERLSLIETPLPPQFQGVEKFGSSSDEMSVLSRLSPSVSETIKKNKLVLTKINRNKTYIDGFIKMKPVEKPVLTNEKRDFITPPLMSIHYNQPMIQQKSNFVRLKAKK